MSAPPEHQIKKFSQICFLSVKDSPTPTKKNTFLYDFGKKEVNHLFLHERVIFQQEVLARIAYSSLIPHGPPRKCGN
jgi:hypothetical protein